MGIYARNPDFVVCENKPALPRRLISAFVIHFLESMITTLSTCTISIFLQVSVAEQSGLIPIRSETLKTDYQLAFNVGPPSNNQRNAIQMVDR